MRPRLPSPRALLIVAAIVVALVGLYALAGFVLLPRWLKAEATQRVQAGLGRTLALGEVAFNPFTLTLEIRDARLPDADGAPLLAFRRFAVNAQLASLWHRGAVLRSIALEGPVVRAVLRADGSLNLADLARLAPPAGAEASTTAPAPLRLAIGEFALSGGEIAFADQRHARPFETRLAPVAFTLRAFSTFEADDNAWHFNARSEAGETLDLGGTLFLSPLRAQGTLALGAVKAATLASYLGDALPFDLADGELALQGGFRFASGAAPDPATSLALDLQSLDVDRLALKARGDDQETLRLDRIELRGGQADLVRRDVRLESVAVRGGRLALWRDAAGGNSISALLPAAPPAPDGPAPAPSPPSSPAPAAPGPAWHFALRESGLEQLAVSFEDRGLASRPRLDVAALAVKTGALSSDLAQPVEATVDLTLASGGTLAATATVTPQTAVARGTLRLADVDLRPVQPWLARATQLTLQSGRASAELDVARDAKGVFTAAGTLGVADFATRDTSLRQDFLKWKQLRLTGVNWRSEPLRLRIREVVAQAPYARVIVSPERHLNVSTVLSPPGTPLPAAPDEDADAPASSPPPAATVPTPGSAPDIAIGSVRITGGSANFADLWIKPNFAVALQDLEGTVQGLSSRADSRAVVDIRGTVDRYAPALISGEVNPLAAEVYSDLHLNFRNLEMTTANPYSGHFAGYRIEKGKLNVDLNYRIDKRRIDAHNKFVIDQLQLGEKVDSPDATSLPVRLAVALMKDRHGVIDIDLPVTGSLDDPKFRVGPLIWKAFVNLIVKAATAPFALLGSLFGGGDEVNQLLFTPGSAALDETAQTRLTALRKGLVERPGLSLEVPTGWSAADREALLDARLPAAVEAAWQQRRPKKDAVATPGQLEALRAEVRGTLVVSDEELTALGRARAAAMQDALLAGGEVDPARVFVINVPPLAAQGERVRLDLTLK
jgi:hypothetical protein